MMFLKIWEIILNKRLLWWYAQIIEQNEWCIPWFDVNLCREIPLGNNCFLLFLWVFCTYSYQTSTVWLINPMLVSYFSRIRSFLPRMYPFCKKTCKYLCHFSTQPIHSLYYHYLKWHKQNYFIILLLVW